MTLALIALVLLTIIIHEGGHLVVGYLYGWRFQAVRLRWWGIAVEMRRSDPRHLWKVAAAGPGASAALAGVFWVLVPYGPLFVVGFWLNVVAVAVNMLPVPVADGGHILRGLRL